MLKYLFIIFSLLSFNSYSQVFYFKNSVSSEYISIDLGDLSNSSLFDKACNDIREFDINQNQISELDYVFMPHFSYTTENGSMHKGFSDERFIQSDSSSQYFVCRFYTSTVGYLVGIYARVYTDEPNSPEPEIPTCSALTVYDPDAEKCLSKNFQFLDGPSLYPLGSTSDLDAMCIAIHENARQYPYFAQEHNASNGIAFYNNEEQQTIDDEDPYNNKKIYASDTWSVSYVTDSLTYKYTSIVPQQHYEISCSAYVKARYADTNEQLLLSKFTYTYELAVVDSCADNEAYSNELKRCYTTETSTCPVNETITIYPVQSDMLLNSEIRGNNNCQLLVTSASLIDDEPFFSQPEWREEYQQCYRMHATYTGEFSTELAYSIKNGDFCWKLEEPQCYQGYTYNTETSKCDHSLNINNSYDYYDYNDPYNPSICLYNDSCASDIPYEPKPTKKPVWPVNSDGTDKQPACTIDSNNNDRCYNPDTAEPAPLDKYPDDAKISSDMCMNGFFSDDCNETDTVQICNGEVVNTSYNCHGEGIYTDPSIAHTPSDLGGGRADESEYQKENEGTFDENLNERFENIKASFDNSRFNQFLQSFSSIVDNSNTCPTFEFDLTELQTFGFDIGKKSLEVPCEVYDFMRILFLIYTMILCRRIIFGA